MSIEGGSVSDSEPGLRGIVIGARNSVGDKGSRGFCWLNPFRRCGAVGEISSALLRDDSGKRCTGRFAASARRLSLSPLSLRLLVDVVDTLRRLDCCRVESVDRSRRTRLSDER